MVTGRWTMLNLCSWWKMPNARYQGEQIYAGDRDETIDNQIGCIVSTPNSLWAACSLYSYYFRFLKPL
jgi:hypothetical protein